MLKNCERLTFVENRSNLCCLKSKMTGEVVINNYEKQEPRNLFPTGSNDENLDADKHGRHKFVEMNHNNSDSNSDEEEESNSMSQSWVIARNKRVPLKDAVINNPLFMQKKLETKNVNDDHHK